MPSYSSLSMQTEFCGIFNTVLELKDALCEKLCLSKQGRSTIPLLQGTRLLNVFMFAEFLTCSETG